MSSAVSAARKRRAGPLPVEPSRNISNTPSPHIQQKAGLTLPEVIALVDKRLVTPEKFMNDSKSNETVKESKIKFELDEPSTSLNISDDIIEEFNNRFLILTEEMSNLKDIIMKLQSYTMSVNKVLMEERIQIISNLGSIEEREEDDNEETCVEYFQSDPDINEKPEDTEEKVSIANNDITEYGIPIPSKIKRIT
jgi:hypothetical protein